MKLHPSRKSFPSLIGLLAMTFSLISSLVPTLPVGASHTPDPTSVTVAGSLQDELGCPGDWQPECASTHLGYDSNDDVWQATFALPAGNFEYKAALNGTWDENYGLGAQPGGANIPLNLGAPASVKFYYDHKSHWITDNKNSVIATVPGSFQDELGCGGDWDPGCLRSWLQDTDGDGIYSFTTSAIPPGNHEAKVTINESWDENYGQGGVPGGANIPFNVPANNTPVTFSYDAATHILQIQVAAPPAPSPDNNVEWDGLRHDSRDTLYRAPGGAVPAGTPVTIRFRTFHNDVDKVKLHLLDVNANGQQIKTMSMVASDVSCYQPGLENDTCDFWASTLPDGAPDNLLYRFIVSDGTDTDYYADNTGALDGGLGSPSDDVVAQSFALMVYDPSFTTPAWAQDAVIYQIFPDRFRDGRKDNNAKTGAVRYDDPVLALPWGTLPEGYCRNYAQPDALCPWRFDDTPPDWSPTKEGPRGRDYMGGDLKGVDQQLNYLKSLGVNTIYFNPVFDAGSNHSYDTQDYYKVDPFFGTQKDWENLVKHADKLGIRIVLDGVFNHMSSDSPFFDRYHHFSTVGACESAGSPYRDWFHFRAPTGSEPSVCAPSTPGGTDTYYDGWFGFDSIPVLNKSNPTVQNYFINNADSVSRHWLNGGASGWRLDVMGDPSFPNGYWENFRAVVKATDPNALIVSELWQKDITLLRFLRGDRADTTMNYRLRDAVLGLLSPGPFDSKGFADSGRIIEPSEFAARLASIQEDYPHGAFYSLMNLLDSHDTERLLWTLTPGSETAADKELNAANLAAGKQRQRLASLIQFTLPGAPTIYYGDEVGITGDDDPDDRRTYPWADRGGHPDNALFAHYQALAALRRGNSVLTDGDLRVLLADDTADTVAYGRKTGSQAAVVVINRGAVAQLVAVPAAGYLPEGTSLKVAYPAAKPPGSFTVTDGVLHVTVNPNSGLLLLTAPGIDLTPPVAPAGLHVTAEGSHQVGLAWNAVGGAAGYNLYRSPVSGGGWVKVNPDPLGGTDFTDTGLRDGQVYYYVVTALDGRGNESAFSDEVDALPHLSIGWANLQWPPSMSHTISVTDRTDNAYGQVWIDGATEQDGATPSLIAQLGFGPDGSNPAGNADWAWITAAYNTDVGNNDEFVASMLPEATGEYDYLYRYSTTNGDEWLYADLNGPIPAGNLPSNPGDLTVNSGGDTTPPSTPTGLLVVSSSPSAIELAWDAIAGDPSLYGYEVLRGATAGGPYTRIARLTDPTYTDTNVEEGATYFYVVLALDNSFNRSGNSGEVEATAAPRTVTLTFNVTVPATTDATGRSVYIAGTLSRLNGGLPDWDPGAVVLTRVDATHWTIGFTGYEGVQLEYKYTLGDWDHVEKDAACGEISNRQLTLTYGTGGNMVVNDEALNWRNVSPCGN